MVPVHQEEGWGTMNVEYTKGGLSTRADSKGGLYWTGVFKYQHGGKWHQKRVTLTDEDGGRIPAGTKSRPKNKKAAEKALDRARADLGTVYIDANQSAADYIEQDLESRRGSIEDSTLTSYLAYMPMFREVLGDVSMKELGVKDVRAWIQRLVKLGKAPRTVRKAFGMLSSVCERAVENGDLAANPCTKSVRRDLPRVSSPEPNALDADGIARVNAILDSTTNPRLRIGARIALHCGLRASEVCGLRWQDIDFSGRMLHVHAAIGTRGQGIGDSLAYMKETKSHAGERYVPMTETVFRELSEWRDHQRQEWESFSKGNRAAVPFDGCYVLGYAEGSFYAPYCLEQSWIMVAKGKRARDPEDKRRCLPDSWEEGHEPILGITGKVVTFHGLRHTYATQLIKGGADVKAASALLGHASAAMTLNFYAAADPDAIRTAASAAAPLLEAGTERMRLRAV